jgi:hypothetical protein
MPQLHFLLKASGMMWLLVALLTGSVSSVPVLAAIDAPEGVLIEAEDPPPPSTHRVIEDADASGGKAVSSDRDWEPVFVTRNIPDAEAVTIHVHYRGGPFIAKGQDADGKQHDLKGVWSAPAQWTWTEVGTYDRAQIGERLIIIRTNRGSLAVDCVVLAPAEKKVLPPSEPDPQAPTVPVRLEVDWDNLTHDITAYHWAVNDYGILRPSDRNNPSFIAYLADLQPELIRIHWARFSEVWTDEATRRWDVEVIRQAVAEVAPSYGDAKLMVNIPDWPRWFHDGGVLPPEKEAAFAELCANLVRVMRDEIDRPVVYWEVMNELENRYANAGRLSDLWRLLGKIMTAMRAVDPEAKFGGPALTWPKPSWVSGYMDAVGNQVDFVTWHNYATDDPYLPNANMFQRADTIAKHAAETLELIRTAQPDRPIQTFLSEYNISWTWRVRDRRMTNNIGAVFHAMIVRRLAELGVNGAMVWHVKDGVYGLLDASGDRRPPAELFLWGHQHLTGRVATIRLQPVHEEIGLPSPGLEVLAVQRQDGTRALLLINPADAPYELELGTIVASGEPLHVRRIDATGVAIAEPPATNAAWLIPGYSLTLVTTGHAP